VTPLLVNPNDKYFVPYPPSYLFNNDAVHLSGSRFILYEACTLCVHIRRMQIFVFILNNFSLYHECLNYLLFFLKLLLLA